MKHPTITLKIQPHSMRMSGLGMLIALVCAASVSFPHVTRADGGGDHHGSPFVSGSGGAPPEWSGTGEPVESGSGEQTEPSETSGSGDPVVTGSFSSSSHEGGKHGGQPAGPFESLIIKVTFAAVTSGSGTSANGVFEALSRSGTESGFVEVCTTGLTTGTYTLSGVSLSASGAVTLGTFAVTAPGTSGTSTGREREHDQCQGKVPLPAGFDPFGVSSLAISDSNANVLFTADLTTVTDGAFFARAPIVSGTTVTGVTGVVQINASAKAGVVKGALKISASGLPASTTYTYAVDGTDIGPVTTGTAGSLKLVATEAPIGGTLLNTVNLFTVTAVTVHDSLSNLILSASF